MYFWHTQRLAKDLRDGALSSGEKLKYVIAWVTLICVSLFLAENDAAPNANWEEYVATLLCLVIFLKYSQRINKKGDDLNFIERLICVSWPETIKFIPCATILAVALELAGRVMPWLYWKILVISSEWCLNIFFLYRIGLKIKWIASKRVTH